VDTTFHASGKLCHSKTKQTAFPTTWEGKLKGKKAKLIDEKVKQKSL
jgi:hypothetical protein